MIRTLPLETSSYEPGEILNHESNEYTHITITYNISGDRTVVDQNIEEAVEQDPHLIKVPYVNTTLYWQINLGSKELTKEELVDEAKYELKRKLKAVFLGGHRLIETKVTAFCMVGNLCGFAFELS